MRGNQRLATFDHGFTFGVPTDVGGATPAAGSDGSSTTQHQQPSPFQATPDATGHQFGGAGSPMQAASGGGNFGIGSDGLFELDVNGAGAGGAYLGTGTGGSDSRTPAISWTSDERVFAMATMPGGQVSGGGNPNGDIAVYDGRTGTHEATLSGHADCVLALLFVESAGVIYSTSADSTVRQWNAETMQNNMIYEGHRGFVVGLCHVALSSGTGLFTGGDDRLIHQWNIGSGACVHTFKGHRGPVNALVGDDDFVYSGASDAMVKVWAISSRRCVSTIRTGGDTVWHLIKLSGDRIAVACADATIRVYENPATSAICVHELHGHSAKVRRLFALEPLLFSAAADANVIVWNLSTGTQIETLSGHVKQVASLGMENNQLYTAGFDHRICRWDAQEILPSKQTVRPFNPLSGVRAKELRAAKEKVEQITQMRNKRRVQSGAATADEVAQLYKALPINFVVQALDVKVQSSSLACEVLFYIPFLVMFCLMFLVARPIEDNFYIVRAINSALSEQQLPSFKVPRTFTDITSVDWFSRWMEMTVTELHATKDYANRMTIRGQNYLIGAMRVRTKRASKQSCQWRPSRLNLEKYANALRYPLPRVSANDVAAAIADANAAAQSTARKNVSNTTFLTLSTTTTTTTAASRSPTAILPSIASVPCYKTFASDEEHHYEREPFFCQQPVGHVCPDNALDLLYYLSLSNPASIVLPVDYSPPAWLVALNSQDQAAAVVASFTDSSSPASATVSLASNATTAMPTTTTTTQTATTTVSPTSAAPRLAARRVPVGAPYGFASNRSEGSSYEGQLQSYAQGGYFLDIPFNVTLLEAMAQMRALVSLGFVDDYATRLVDVSFHVYNPAVDLFVYVQLIMEIPNGGSWVGRLSRQTGYQIFRLRASGVLVLEAFFGLFFLFFVYFFIKEAYDEIRNSRFLSFLLSWWTLMEFANLSAFCVMYFYRYTWMKQGPDTDIAAVLHSKEYPGQLEAIVTLYQVQIWCTAVTTILTFLKLLKYVRLNERLNVLTRTLDAAQQALAGVIFLFVYVVFAFAISGYALYGNGVYGYRNLSAAYVMLLRTLLGDGVYDDLSDEARATTLVYYWSFHVLCLFILLNFLVAVISDAFADVSHAGATIPLDVSIVKAFQDAKFECLPKNLRNKLTLLRFRRTQTMVVKSMLAELRIRRDAMIDADAAKRHDYDECEDVVLHKEDFLKLVPPEMLNPAIGDEGGSSTVSHMEEFLSEVWKDLTWEYFHQVQGSLSVDERERESIIQEELQQALRPVLEALPVIEAVRQRLAVQEEKLRGFVHTLSAELRRQSNVAGPGNMTSSFDFAGAAAAGGNRRRSTTGLATGVGIVRRRRQSAAQFNASSGDAFSHQDAPPAGAEGTAAAHHDAAGRRRRSAAGGLTFVE